MIEHLRHEILDLAHAIREAGSKHETETILHRITEMEKHMARTQVELANDLKAITAQVAKIGVETGNTLQKVTDLEAALANGGTLTPEVETALAELKAQAQVTDDLVPDAPANPPTP